jgi:hypothetical protein
MLVTCRGQAIYLTTAKALYSAKLRLSSLLALTSPNRATNAHTLVLTQLAMLDVLTDSSFAIAGSCSVTQAPQRRLLRLSAIRASSLHSALTHVTTTTPHKVARLGIITSKLVFAESGLYDHLLNTLAKSTTLRLMGYSIAKLASTSPLESASTLLYRLAGSATRVLHALNRGLSSTRTGVAALGLMHLFLVVAFFVLLVITFTSCLTL